MNIIIVDDEKLAVDNMIALLRQVEPQAEVTGFTDPEQAFRYLFGNQVDIAFLDIEMGNKSGIVLAKRCKDLCPRVNIIFVTGYSEYSLDAIRLRASGYLLKPVRAADLRTELDNLRNPLPEAPKARVRLQTFGNFDVFVDGRPLEFSRTKCRECLAYLTDRKGAHVSMRELSAVLWGDRPYDRTAQNNLHQVVFSMMQTLKAAGVEDIIIRNRKEIAIDISKVDCDYYAALNGDTRQLNRFTGEYMSNYGWAEFTVGELFDKKGLL